MLQVDKLCCGYDKKPVLEDISFNINQGEVVGIIGPNGAGKTTLFRAITKLITPQKGEIFLFGKNMAQISAEELSRKIAVVSQDINFVFNMTVREFVALGRIPYQQRLQFFESSSDEHIIDYAMKITDVYELKHRDISTLSGGERQLAIIAKALAQQPQLILLDEPTVYLDISHQVQVLDLVRRLNREKQLSVIVILHELNLASEYCDRLILLHKRKIHSLGAPDEVLNYRTIEEVYNTVVVVQPNPVSKKPNVLIVPGMQKNRRKK
ncbi:MAG: ABC transporter ATP-binding protein [Candidatus Omnitrophica bacterium]|nr:ABC transporter ATP-binding protein [Candidatus Omnitrophota bacterium]